MSDTSMDISVKTINNESFSYTLPLTTIVSDLKRMLRDSTTIDIPRQRLIFRGRVLQDHLLLTDYSIACGNVLHMVARPTADTEAVDEAARNAMQSTANHPAATSSSYGISQFSNEVNNLQGSQSVAEGNQLQQLARNELELLDQLLSGQPQGQQEPDAALHSQHQHDLQRQQLFSSDISSYSFQSTSRFAVVPSSTSAGAPSSSSLAPTPFSPTTSTSPRPHVNSSSDSIERIRQGLLTMDTIISTFEADTTASTLQPLNSRRISVPVTSSAANSNSETTSTIPGKSVRQSGSSLSNTAESTLSETNCVTDGVGIKIEDDLQLNGANGILEDNVVFEKAAGVGLNNSTHSTGSEGQKETETEIQSTNEDEDDVGSSALSVKPIDVSKGAQESLCSPVEAGVSSDSPRTAALNLNLKSESETEILTGTGTEIETEALKGAVSELDIVQLKEETPSRPRDSQNQSQSQRQREVKRQYFVGQWVDVKDTVSQWLEATVMMIDEDGQRVFIHYNGWPIRWDEWLPFMTPRIAPFRTRTLHSPQHFHTLPIPNALNLPNVRSALPYPLLLETCPEEPKSRRPSVRGRVHSDLIEREKSRREREEGKSEEGTGEESKNGDTVEGEEAVREGVTVDQDSILSLLPTIARMMRTLQPRIDAAARIAVQVLQPQDATAEDTATASERDKEFKRIADELCPLADRFGRVLTDLSPLLRALGSTTAPALSPIGNGITTWGAQNPLSPDYFPAPEHPSNNMLEMSLASLLRPRAPSPPPLRAFRQPISTSAQPPLGLGLRSAVLLGGGSIGIGIDPQTQTPGVQGLGMQSLGGLRGTTRLGLGASGGGIFDIHIAVLPPSRRDGPNILNVSNPLHAPSAALSSVNADLATQSLIFVPQENIAGSVPQTSSGETASAPATVLGRATVNSSSSGSSSSSRGVSNGVFPAPRPVPPSSSSVTEAGSTPSQLIVSDPTSSNATPPPPPPLNPTLSTPQSPPGLPSVTSLILPGSSPPVSDSTEVPPPSSSSSSSSSSASLLNTSEAVTNSTSEPLPAQNSSVAFSTWLDARREEREMEREIDRLRAMLRNREQEYEEAIRSILSLEGGAAGTSALARTGARVDTAVVRDEGVVVGVEGSAEGGSGTGQSHTPASLPDISTMASSVDTAPSIRAQAVNDATSTAYSSREDSTFSNASQSSQEVHDRDLVYSARDSNNVNTANSSQPHGRGGIWRANATPVPPSVIQPSSTASNISELAASEFADTDDTSMGTPSTVVGSESESTETGIATATTGMGGSRDGDGDGDGDRLTVECSSNSQSGSREGDDVPDSNTQASSSAYSDVGSPRSSVGVFQSTRHLGSSSLDSNADTNNSSGTCTDTCTKSSSQSDLAALANSRLDHAHAHANVIVLDGTRGSIEKVGKEVVEEGDGVEGGKEAETAHVGCYIEKDFESLSSGSISAETIDAYIKLKDPSGKGNGAKLESGQLMRAMTEASEESKSQKGIMMEVAVQQRAAVLPLYGTVAAPKVPLNDGRQVPSTQYYSKASAPSSSSSSSSPSFTGQTSSSTSALMDGTQHSSSSTLDHPSAYIDGDVTELLSAAKHDENIFQQIPEPSSSSSETLLLSSKLLKSKERGEVEYRSGEDEDVVEEKVEEGKNEESFEREKEKHSVPSDVVGSPIVSAQGRSASSGAAGERRSSGSRILSGTLRRIRSSFSLFKRSSRAK